MKKLLWFVLIGGGLAYFIWKYVFGSGTKSITLSSPTVQTTGSQTGFAAWFPGWNGFTAASLNNVTGSVNAAFAGLKSIGNNFGFNDGGTNPGVSISGSQNGGISSSGSGTATPTNNDLFSFASLYQNPPSSLLYNTPLLNGYGSYNNGNDLFS